MTQPQPPLSEAVQVALKRRLAAAQPDAYEPALVSALVALSHRLAELGRHDEGLRVADEAVDLAEALDERLPGSHRWTYAWALSNLAMRLSNLGDHNGALAVGQESVEIYRAIDRSDPGGRAGGLGNALVNLAADLPRLGRHEEAYAAASEACELIRAARAEARDAHTPLYVLALNNLAATLAGLGRLAEAIDAAKRSVNVCRTLDGQYRLRLAHVLRTLAHALGTAGRHREALDAVEESIAVARRRLAGFSEHNEARRELARSLSSCADELDELERPVEAMAASEEATELWRILAGASPRSYAPYLVSELSSMTIRRYRLNQRAGMLAAAEEAVEIARSHQAAYRGDDPSLLARALDRLAASLRVLGRDSEAIGPAQEAAAIRRTATQARPQPAAHD